MPAHTALSMKACFFNLFCLACTGYDYVQLCSAPVHDPSSILECSPPSTPQVGLSAGLCPECLKVDYGTPAYHFAHHMKSADRYTHQCRLGRMPGTDRGACSLAVRMHAKPKAHHVDKGLQSVAACGWWLGLPRKLRRELCVRWVRCYGARLGLRAVRTQHALDLMRLHVCGCCHRADARVHVLLHG